MKIGGKYYKNYNGVSTKLYRAEDVSVERYDSHLHSSVPRRTYDDIIFIILATRV